MLCVCFVFWGGCGGCPFVIRNSSLYFLQLIYNESATKKVLCSSTFTTLGPVAVK